MENLREVIDAVKRFFTPRWGGVRPYARGGGPPHATPPGLPPHNRGPQARPNNFPPRHLDQEQTAFRPISPEGLFMKRTEEWTRQGNTAISRVQQTLVVTNSGEVVRPEQVRLKCFCGGYENVVHHCRVCGRGLCRLCVRRFRSPDGAELILCERDLRLAIDAFDTWQLRQRR